MSGDASGAVDLLADVLGVSTAPPVASTTTPVALVVHRGLRQPGHREGLGEGRLADGVGPGARRRHVGGHRPARRGRHREGAPPRGRRHGPAPGHRGLRGSTGGGPAGPGLDVGGRLADGDEDAAVGRTDGTDWTVRRSDPKDVQVQVTGVAGVTPTGTVDVWVNGMRRGSATLDARGTAVVTLPKSTTTSLVVVSYGGDRTYLPWIAAPHLLVVR